MCKAPCPAQGGELSQKVQNQSPAKPHKPTPEVLSSQVSASPYNSAWANAGADEDRCGSRKS